MQIWSSTSITIRKTPTPDGTPYPWRSEPGPLKVVAIDTGTGVVQLNPEGGGVVVAVVRPDVVVQENGSLRIYQSTKEFQVNGSGFEDGMQASSSTGALLLPCPSLLLLLL